LLQPSEPTVDDELTHRQVEILKLIAQGRASKEIAYELGLSPKTVDVHRARIMERLRLNDIASLTLYAVRKGLIALTALPVTRAAGATGFFGMSVST
jgi:DNA-binding NarL/FixJ family response regulator